MIKKIFLFPLIFLVISSGITPLTSILNCQDKEQQEEALRKPIIKNGRYYYSENDTHDHMPNALSFLRRKMIGALISIKIISKIASYFGVQQIKVEPVTLKYPFPEPIQTKPAATSIEPAITWIGHASFLIQTDGFNILTDPVFSNVYKGLIPVTKRYMAPGIKLEDLPKIDAIVISHNHDDHTNQKDIVAIKNKYPDVKIYVPERNSDLFTRWGFKKENIIEKTWWDEEKITKDNQDLTLTLLPAKHWSIDPFNYKNWSPFKSWFKLKSWEEYNPLSYRHALWGSWMISSGKKNIYFAGDTAYEDHFGQIGRKFPNIDVALLPIGPTHKDCDEHNPCHTNSKEAVQALIDLNAKYFIPMHYATFFPRPNSYEYPVNSLVDTWEKRKNELQDKKLLIAQCGKTYQVDKIATEE